MCLPQKTTENHRERKSLSILVCVLQKVCIVSDSRHIQLSEEGGLCLWAIRKKKNSLIEPHGGARGGGKQNTRLCLTGPTGEV